MIIQNYLLALRETVGNEHFPLALSQLKTAKENLNAQRTKILLTSKTNAERKNLLGKWFGDFLVDEVKNLIILLVEKGALAKLDDLPDKDLKKESIIITTPQKITSQLEKFIQNKLLESDINKPVTFSKDETLIGGVKIRVGDREIDNSLKTKLARALTGL